MVTEPSCSYRLNVAVHLGELVQIWVLPGMRFTHTPRRWMFQLGSEKQGPALMHHLQRLTALCHGIQPPHLP